MPRLRHLVWIIAFPVLLPQAPVQAQRGELIEGLFRTIAEAQLERERRKRAEAERAAVQPRLPDRNQELNLPPSFVGPNRRPNQTPSINVRSREAAEFARNLVQFNASILPMVTDLRSGAAQNPALRALLPDAYRISADTRSLIQQCDGLGALQPIVAPYSELDARWRQLSFGLRSIDGLSDRCTTSIRSCDKLVGSMTRQLNIQPQFDRHQLHDLMIVGATHMLALLDDLQLAPITISESESLAHDCRLLRQRLLGEADRVEESTYAEVVTRFTDFVARWRKFSEEVYAINDPHMNLRLNRIAETGDQTYAMLWMPPPYNARSLTISAQRLEQTVGQLLDQLTIRALASLSRRDQTRLFEASRNLYEQCRAFQATLRREPSRGELQQQFSRIDRDWQALRRTYSGLPSVNRATVAGVDHTCRQLRGALGLSAQSAPVINIAQLVEIAAALEGSSEYLDADVQRYQRYFQPASFRKSILDSSREFKHHAKQLHAGLTEQADLVSLQREAGHMFDGWQQLTKAIDHIETHGLSEIRAGSLKRDQRELEPLVAQIAAALLER